MNEEDIEFKTADWQEVEIIIEPRDKAPKKYGEGVYRFFASMTLSVIMPRRGWELVKQAKSYAYLRPPANEPKPYTIKIKIPTEQQAREIAQAFFERGKTWMGQLGEWPAFYVHKHQAASYLLGRDEATGEMTQTLGHVFDPTSWLSIGQFGVWEVKVDKRNDEAFTYHEHGIIKGRTLSSPPSATLFEGQELTVEQTLYERNLIARRQCIAHYGTTCQICTIDFGKVYGDIGLGFIHVHHIVPISVQGGEYQVDPIKDLIPLCPNCHAMVHRNNPPFSIDELTALYQKHKN